MRSFHCFFLLVLTFLSLSKANPASQTTDEYACNSSISECREKEELLMESEISRRFLEQRRYISVGALKRDKPVCDAGAGGESYTQSGGCLPPPSNPVSRGCSKYYRCRSDSWSPCTLISWSIFKWLLLKSCRQQALFRSFLCTPSVSRVCFFPPLAFLLL